MSWPVVEVAMVNTNRFNLNAAKSNTIILKPKLHSTLVEMNFSFAVGLINVVSSANYLGVLINDKLNFQEHIKYSERKVSRSVGMLRKLKKYLPELALFKLYYTLIHSHLIY